MEQVLKDTTANPAPLGLFGFGMTTILLNIHNAGFFELNSMIMGMGIFFGGTQQVIAGIMEWKKGNGFAMAALPKAGPIRRCAAGFPSCGQNRASGF